MTKKTNKEALDYAVKHDIPRDIIQNLELPLPQAYYQFYVRHDGTTDKFTLGYNEFREFCALGKVFIPNVPTRGIDRDVRFWYVKES